MSPARPQIAVVVPLTVLGASPQVQAIVDRFTTSALHLLSESGARPWVVDTSSRTRPAAGEVSAADGVLLLGGGDMDPALYGLDEHVPDLYGVDREGDLHALEVVRASHRSATPLLGICRGSQVLNVALGGTLTPHLEDTGTHRRVEDGGFTDEKIDLEPGSWAREVLGASTATVRSGHHQAIDRVGQHLRPIARALDGTVEGVEHTGWWANGVQWHPEDPDGDPSAGSRLFTSFVDAVSGLTGPTGR